MSDFFFCGCPFFASRLTLRGETNGRGDKRVAIALYAINLLISSVSPNASGASLYTQIQISQQQKEANCLSAERATNESCITALEDEIR